MSSQVKRFWVTVMVPSDKMQEEIYAPINAVFGQHPNGTLFHDGIYDMDYTEFEDLESATAKSHEVMALGIAGLKVKVIDTNGPLD